MNSAAFYQTSSVRVHLNLLANLCAIGGAVLDDPLQLLVDELDTAHAGLL